MLEDFDVRSAYLGITKLPSREALQDSFTRLGMALQILHEMERFFAQATLLGLTDKQRRKHETMNDLWAARDKMTFGQMVLLFKEDYILPLEFEKALDAFVLERNVIVHRITTLEGYRLDSTEDRERLNERISTFIEQALFFRKFFHGAFLASNEFARGILKSGGVDIPVVTPDEWQAHVNLFRGLATYRERPEDSTS